MEIKLHEPEGQAIAEVLAEQLIIHSTDAGLNLVGDLYFRGHDKVILHKKNISSEFFDLKTGVAGEILQKFSNYRVRLAIVGDFSNIPSLSLRDFIFESNKRGYVNFVGTVEEALRKLVT